jgi:hypothetical protein
MKKFALVAFAAATLAATASAPALATGRDPDPKPVATEAAAAQPSMDKRICLSDRRTGSRLAHKTCKTRGEWIAETGQDPVKTK